MAARVYVYGGGEGLDEYGLFDAPLDPVVLARKD